MAVSSFPAVMRSIFRSEGGYVDHPRDPGGATNLGITIGTLRSFRQAAVSKSDVRRLTRTEASEIYRRRYWRPIRGAELPAGADLAVMDAAVNSGPRRAVRWAARAVGAGAPKAMTPELVARVQQAPATRTINRMLDDRLNWLRSLRHWPAFGTGWTRRIHRVRAECLELARSSPKRDAGAVAAPVVIGAEQEPAVRETIGLDAAILPGWAAWLTLLATLAGLAWWHRAWLAWKIRTVRDLAEDLLASLSGAITFAEIVRRFRQVRADIRHRTRQLVDEAGELVDEIEEIV